MRDQAELILRDHIPAGTPKERALLLAAYLTDKTQVREIGGSNRGPWVEAFLRECDLGAGNPWCGSFVYFCLRLAGYPHLPSYGPAAVRNWAAWADDNGRITQTPQRGDLFYWLNANGSGHIGFVVRKLGPVVFTIEGNSDEAGSREGARCIRRVRNASKLRFIRL